MWNSSNDREKIKNLEKKVEELKKDKDNYQELYLTFLQKMHFYEDKWKYWENFYKKKVKEKRISHCQSCENCHGYVAEGMELEEIDEDRDTH